LSQPTFFVSTSGSLISHIHFIGQLGFCNELFVSEKKPWSPVLNLTQMQITLLRPRLRIVVESACFENMSDTWLTPMKVTTAQKHNE
jgi:hypothetical protein